MKSIPLAMAVLLLVSLASAGSQAALLKVGVAGLTHDHVHGVLRRNEQDAIQIVGIAESNRELAERYSKRYGFSMEIVFDTLAEMLQATKPTVVSDYGSIYQHLETVEACAPRGIHVMVEKPLAVSLAHARKMEVLVEKHNIHLLTNFETTWYPSHHLVKRMLAEESAFGGIRKIVVHDGHQGPVEIGCSREFVEWLTDPKLNGAGALNDFGCYGANLSTWLMNGEKPITVTAVTQQIKPDVYPHVDDEATIVLTYTKTQAILQASWNWDYNRKDIEIYCKSGHIHCTNDTQLQVRRPEQAEEAVTAEELVTPLNDPYDYFVGVLAGKVDMQPTDLSAFENNLTVMEILQAAKVSAKTGKTVRISELSGDQLD